VSSSVQRESKQKVTDGNIRQMGMYSFIQVLLKNGKYTSSTE
jgi:hypothetical protein